MAMNDGVTVSLLQMFDRFPDAEAARIYLEDQRWNGKPVCPHCGSAEKITARKGKRLGYYRCRECKGPEFTVRTASIFERSHVPLHKWIYAIYMVVTVRKGVSSMQLSKEISVTQPTAWFVLGRLREACGGNFDQLRGIVEVDETYIGGKRKNMSKAKRKELKGRGTADKTPVIGARERGGKVAAQPLASTDERSLIEFVEAHTEQGVTVYTDDAKAYANLPTILNQYQHESVKHSAGEYVRGEIHTNSIESVWSVFKRSLTGTWHHVSDKHLGRYVNEATFRLNEGNVKIHTLDRMAAFLRRAFRRRLTYRQLTA